MIDNHAKIKPLGTKVVLRVLPRSEQTASGLYLAEQRGREDTGEVLAVGPHVRETLRAGDVVCFDPYKVQCAIDADGPAVTNSVHAKAGSLAIMDETALRYARE